MVLKNHQSFRLDLGKLPKGKYVYKFGVHGPAEKSGKLSVSTESNGTQTDPRVILFTNSNTEHELIIDCKEDFASTSILFRGDTDQSCTLNLPVSALSMQEVADRPASLSGFDQNLLSQVNALESAENLLKKNREHTAYSGDHSSFSKQIDSKEIEAFINLRYFKGFLSEDESMRQLDFVVYDKMFKNDGSKGFTKFKRKVYRKVFIFLYRSLTKNRSRKQYFAKLYRNYINSNLLAENYHQHQ